MFHPYTQTMLRHMGLDDEQIKSLDQTSNEPLDPVLYQAIDLIKKAINNQQKIFVAGDYDADGICSTAILVRLFRQMGAQVGFYIPNRINEGYGLNLDIASSAIEKGYDCFVMVDNGVSLFDVHQFLKQQQKTTLVIDHHTIDQSIDVDCLIHPDVLSDHFDQLCGAGLSYLLTQAAGLDDDVSLQLATVATIGDLMPLWRYNRQLVRKGLKVINERPMPHISSLLKKQVIDEEDIAFLVVPKLNAVGRLSDLANVNNVVTFLLSEDATQILSFVTSLEQLNQTRKDMLKDMLEAALAKIDGGAFNFIVDESFHEGIVGILAGHIARLTQRPTLVATIKKDVIKGSLRSEHIDLHALMSKHADAISHFGGHAKAAGIEIKVEDYERFVDMILTDLNNDPPIIPEITKLHLDSSLIEMEGVKEFEHFRPFGMGFERPIVRLENCRVIKRNHMPKHNLSKWILQFEHAQVEAITFDPIDEDLKEASFLHFEGTIAYKPYNGYEKIVLRVDKVESILF